MFRAFTSVEVARRAIAEPIDTLLFRLAWQRLSERSETRSLNENCLSEPDSEPEDCTGRLRLDPSDSLTIERNRSDAFTAAVELESRSSDERLMLVVGADAVHDIVSSEAEQDDFGTGAMSPAPSRFPDGSTWTETGIFAQLGVDVTPRLGASAGLRGSAFVLDVTPRSAENGGPSPGFERTFLDFASEIGLRFTIAERFAWFANAGRGVRAPNVQDFATLGPRALGRFQLPHPEIEPEHTYSADTGFKLTAKRHQALLSVFYLHYDDAIVVAPTTLDGASVTPEGDEYVTSFNAASIEIYGIEAGADVAIVSPAAAFGRLLAMVGTQRNPPNSGLPLETPADRIPPVQGDLGIRLAPEPSWEVELFASGRAAQRRLNDPVNLDDNRIPDGGTPGYVTLHAHFAWRAEPRLLTRLLLDNLSNRLVLEHGSGFYRPGFSGTVVAELTSD
jgi:outer membrane receptor protein involved in Fe transport